MPLRMCYDDEDGKGVAWHEIEDHVSPFNIHPDIEKVYNLSEFGYSFIIQHGSDQDILEEFCQGTTLSKDDFQQKYLYFGQYLYTTEKQYEFKVNFDKISRNIKNSAWNLNTYIYVPKWID
jgi:hypothetical protein